ncbi:hypothetical protein BDR05DRAFT_950954 [Suillus weaverae]|nr:hypothetical protein BDR05DRAFT_950954 [Suillus weaverae]
MSLPNKTMGAMTGPRNRTKTKHDADLECDINSNSNSHDDSPSETNLSFDWKDNNVTLDDTPIPAPSSSKHPLDASDHSKQPPILKHKHDQIIAIDAEDGPDILNRAFDHLEDTNFGDTGPEDRDREEEEEACIEDTSFGYLGPKDREEEKEAHVEDIIPENFDEDMLGWMDKDLDELQQMAHLEDTQDTLLSKLSVHMPSSIIALNVEKIDGMPKKLTSEEAPGLWHHPDQAEKM